MIIPAQLDRIANDQEARGARVFFRALRAMYLDLANKFEQGQELRVNTDIAKKAIQTFHIQEQVKAAEWQYNAMDKNLHGKAMQMGMYERINQAVRTWVMLNTGASITSISDTTLDLVKQMIANGQENGYGARKIAANIRAEAKGTFTAFRATVIARTEGTRAASQGHKIGAEQWEKVTGQKKWKSWSASADSRTRDNHRSMIGSLPIPGGEDFIVGGSAMDAPGDPRGGAENCVSCRCRAVYMSERIARKLIADAGGTVAPVIDDAPPEAKPETAAPVTRPKPIKPVDDPDIIDITPVNVPKKLEVFKKAAGIDKVDESIFGMLNEPVEMTVKGGGSHLNPQTMVVNLSPKTPSGYNRSKWNAESVVYHEYGHAIDFQRGLHKSPEVKNLMDKHRRELAENGGYRKLNDRINKDAENLWNKQDLETLSQAEAVADTLMSLNPHYGFGHSKEYFKINGRSEAEFIAHAFENEFKGNPYFKKVAPKLYKDMTNYVKKLK